MKLVIENINAIVNSKSLIVTELFLKEISCTKVTFLNKIGI